MGLPGGSAVKNAPAVQELEEMWAQLLGWEDSLEKDKATQFAPLQFACLENPTDRGAWWSTVHKVTKHWTWLKWLGVHTLIKVNKSKVTIIRAPSTQKRNLQSHHYFGELHHAGCDDIWRLPHLTLRISFLFPATPDWGYHVHIPPRENGRSTA